MKKVNDTQLSVLVFVCAAVRLITSQQLYGAFSAQIMLAALLVKFAILCVVLFALKNTKINIMSPQSAWLAALIFSSSCAYTAIETENFYRYTCDKPLDVRFVIIFIIGAASCALFCGDGTVSRTAQIACVFIVGSAVVLFFSSIKNADISKLDMQVLTMQKTSKALLTVSYIPVETLLLIAFCSDKARFKKGVGIMLCTFLLFAVLLVTTELVFGTATQSELRPLQRLTHVGSISVFKRLDAAYVFVWLFALLAKTACMLSAAKSVLCVYFEENRSGIYAVILTAVFAIGLSYVNAERQREIASACVLLCLIISFVRKRLQKNAC